MFAYAYLSVILTDLHAALGRAIAARHYITVAVSLVEGYFFPEPVDDTIAWRCLCEAVRLFVGEQRGRGRQEEDCVYGSHIDVFVGSRDLLTLLDIVKTVAGELNSGMRYSVVGGLASRVDCNGKGMNIGKSETMNVGLQYPARKRRFEVRKGKRKGGHVDVFSSVRNVRFGILVRWLSANSAKIDFVSLFTVYPSSPQRDAAIYFG